MPALLARLRMMLLLLLLLLLAAAGGVSCLSADIGDGELRCTPSEPRPCPDEMVCLLVDGDGRCFSQSSASAASRRDAGRLDK